MVRRLPIATQVMLLVALGVLLAAGTMAAITLGGPPPRQPPTLVSSIVRVLQTGENHGPMRFLIEESDSAPTVERFAENPRIAAQIATKTGEPANRFRAYTEDATPFGPDFIIGDFVIAQQEQDGSWTVVRRGPDRDLIRWQRVTFTTIGAVMLIILGLAWVAARRIVQPIQDLGRAARLSKTGAPWRLEPPSGPPEIAAAATELRDLHERNRQQAEQRMTMLAAIAHDVGTPLARIAFRNEALDEKDRLASQRDIDTIRELLSDSMTLARGWSGEAEVLDFAELVRGIVERVADTGGETSFVSDGPSFVKGSPLSLERMVQNLVDNAIRYGGKAEVKMGWDSPQVWLQVSDDGPGFPDVPHEQLLRPFVRGEKSRNAEHGGSGLGLAIAAQVVAQHGGSIELGSSPGGGASVCVRLPSRLETED